MKVSLQRVGMLALGSVLCAGLLVRGPEAGAQSVHETSIADLQNMLASGEVTSLQLVEQYLARIEAFDRAGPRLNSIVRVNPAAREAAAELDRERAASGPRGPLHGIPVLVKDNYNTTDMPTTGSSVALAEFIPNAASTQVEKLLAAGAIVLAKTNLHEYAYGITSVSSLTGQTRNPYDYRRVPGGSSGGTGAAVAASFGAVGMGSDTCGSIRIPSAFNNLVGLRPSKGASSIHGVLPLSHTQDTAGPLARNLDDLAIVLDIVSGFDANDPATEAVRDRPPTRFRERLGEVGLEGLRFGKLDGYFERADGATRDVIEDALEWLQEQGVAVVSVEIPDLADLIGRSGVIGHEFRTDLEQYLAQFGSEQIAGLADIVDLGLYHQAVAGQLNRSRDAELDEEVYQEALATRGVLRTAVERVLEDNELDALVYPTIGRIPVFIGEPQPGNNCSIAANSGLPALSLPAGFSDSGLPVGMELLGGFLQDERLLAIGYAIETGYPQRQPPVVTPELVDGQPTAPRVAVLAGGGFAALESDVETGIEVNGEFRFEPALNLLRWELRFNQDMVGQNIEQNPGQNPARAQALGLVFGEPQAPMAIHLAGPDLLNSESANVSGSIFLSPQSRAAIEDGPVFLKAFAGAFATSGAASQLNFETAP